MIIVEKISEVREVVALMNRKNSLIGFVPTMGALHQGHSSLIKKAKFENQLVICSIFVNPTQFNNKNDLQNYPRTPEKDAELLSHSGCDILFMPPVSEIYPDKELLDMDFGHLELEMEGSFRPGHFKGVATVVSRLFEIVKPDRAYFGEKDFQQLAIIREMNRRLETGITIVGCETLREPDGLAMSSRNIHLTAAERNAAGIIYQSLIIAAKQINNEEIVSVRETAIAAIESFYGFKVQYLEFVDSQTLQPIDKWIYHANQRACIAVLTSHTRLIDNVAL